jgi:hypothetical protein
MVTPKEKIRRGSLRMMWWRLTAPWYHSVNGEKVIPEDRLTLTHINTVIIPELVLKGTG